MTAAVILYAFFAVMFWAGIMGAMGRRGPNRPKRRFAPHHTQE